MDKSALKEQARAAVLERADAATATAKDILAHPEPGYREARTSRVVADWFRAMGLDFRQHLALTGLRADIVGAHPGPSVAVIGELDSLIVPGHPFADPNTNAAHACGHHAQIGTILAVAHAINRPEVKANLHGRVAIMVLPAEEYIELEYRLNLRREGKIEFLGGKPEYIRLGLFDDVDMAILTHATSEENLKDMASSTTLNGTIAKQAVFLGTSAHAGAAPHRGTNALNAAMLALSAIHALRETFQDNDHVRVHPIITKGGDAVSAVPADVRLETFVRGLGIEAIRDAERKVDRALRAGAMAMGAEVHITTLAGYLPLHSDHGLGEVYAANAEEVVGKDRMAVAPHRSASTDMGDLSHLMPTIQPFAGGFTGVGHGNDFVARDYGKAIVNPAMVTAMTVIDLLSESAVKANELKARYKAPLTKATYLAFMRGVTREEHFSYRDDGKEQVCQES
ncbi:MAG: amidohydrolase [SAR202 cluster bacterium]|nr:amidohydrolase [SAR202 cluster bacterium]